MITNLINATCSTLVFCGGLLALVEQVRPTHHWRVSVLWVLDQRMGRLGIALIAIGCFLNVAGYSLADYDLGPSWLRYQDTQPSEMILNIGAAMIATLAMYKMLVCVQSADAAGP